MSQVTVIPTDELRQMIREAVNEQTPIPAQTWGVKDVAKFLNVSTGTVYTLAANGEIPHRKAGDRYIFHPDAVNEWAEGLG